jgi:hypothetical protein
MDHGRTAGTGPRVAAEVRRRGPDAEVRVLTPGTGLTRVG